MCRKCNKIVFSQASENRYKNSVRVQASFWLSKLKKIYSSKIYRQMCGSITTVLDKLQKHLEVYNNKFILLNGSDLGFITTRANRQAARNKKMYHDIKVKLYKKYKQTTHK